jgi:hypothetical protein
MTNRGAFAIGVMVAIGIVLATFSVFFHRSQGARCLDRWGVADANRIRHAPQIEVWKLTPAESSNEDQSSEPPSGITDSGHSGEDQTIVAGRKYSIMQRVSLASARGLVHARHALVVDANYDWSLPEEQLPENANYSHAILFRGTKSGASDPQQTILYFDFTRGWVTSDRGRHARLVEKLSQAELAFLERELARATPAIQPEG